MAASYLTIGVASSQSPLSVSLVDLYSSPPYTIKSRSTTKIKVHVSSTEESIQGANVSLFITDYGSRMLDPNEGGTLSPINGFTDENGDLSVTYTPPSVKSPLPIFISATGTKVGYLEGQGKMEVQIQPSLDITVTPDSSIIKPGQKSKITIRVTIFGTDEPISGAWTVLKSLNDGTFSQDNGKTNENGEFITEYTAPIIEGTDLVSILVEKSGFGDRTTSWISIKISEVVLSAPDLISPEDGEVLDPQHILKWGPVSGAKEYELFLGDTVSVSELKNGFLTTSSDYTPLQPLSKDTYYWKVRAIDESGQLGPLSETRSFSVATIPPSIDEFYLESTTIGGEVIIRADITPGNSPIKSVKATIKKQDSTTDTLDMLLKDDLYEGLYIAPINLEETSMEFEVNLIVEDTQGEMATSSTPQKFKVLPLPKFNLTIKSSPEGLSTIPESGIYQYTKGSNVSLPDDQKSSGNFVFEHWLVDGIRAIGKVTMDENHEAVAVFKEVEEKIESKPEVVAPVITPPSEVVPITEEPIITTVPPTTQVPSIPISTPSKVKSPPTSSRRFFLIAIILVAIVIAISRASPELIKARVRGVVKKEIEPKEEPVALEVEEPEEELIITEEEAEEPVEIPVVEPETPEIEPEEEVIEEEVEEPEKEPKEIPVVETEILGLLETIKEIEDSGDEAMLRVLVRKLLNKDPKMAMKDVLAHLDGAVGMGLIKKDLLKNKDGIIEIKYSLTDVGTDCVIGSS
ncbi:MAG: hypothetical protein ACE5J5_01255 [Candidatus Hydrothermarchaeales archaeon]